MRDYSAYVTAVYLLAVLVYGGSAVLWRLRLGRLRRRLEQEEGAMAAERGAGGEAS